MPLLYPFTCGVPLHSFERVRWRNDVTLFASHNHHIPGTQLIQPVPLPYLLFSPQACFYTRRSALPTACSTTSSCSSSFFQLVAPAPPDVTSEEIYDNGGISPVFSFIIKAGKIGRIGAGGVVSDPSSEASLNGRRFRRGFRRLRTSHS